MITNAERRQILYNILTLETSQGNRVAWVGEFEAHIWRRPAPINHVLHAVLTLLTFGLWLIVWGLVAVTAPVPVLFGVSVDPNGMVQQFPVLQPGYRKPAKHLADQDDGPRHLA